MQAGSKSNSILAQSTMAIGRAYTEERGGRAVWLCRARAA